MATFKAPQHEMSEAELFKKKFPGQGMPRQSDFLRKRMQGKGGAKYFDSGDYNMAKTKNANVVTGKAIPTPDTLPQRKTSSTKQSNLLETGTSPPVNVTAEEKARVDSKQTNDEQKTKQLITEDDSTSTPST